MIISKLVCCFNVRRYIYALLSVFLCLFFNEISGQTKDDIKVLRKSIIQSVYASDNEYLKYLDYYTKSNAADALVFRIKSQLIRGNYDEAVISLNKLKILSNNNDPSISFSHQFMAYQTSYMLNLKRDATEHQKEFVKLLKEIPFELPFELAVDSFAFDFLSKKEQQDYFFKILSFYNKNGDYYSISKTYYFLGNSELNNKNLKKALFYFKSSYTISRKNNLGEAFDLYGITGISMVYNALHNYNNTFSLLKEQKEIALNVPDLLLKSNFLETYSHSAAALNNDAELKWAVGNYKTLISNNESKLIEGRSILVDNIEHINEGKLESQKLFWRNVYTILGAFFLLLLAYLIYRSKRKNKLEITEEKIQEADLDPKIFSVPDKTEKEIIEKLDEFVALDKYRQSNISLKALAIQLDTNPRYLSEIINKHKHVNFNTYINNLRIEYILKKLNEDEAYRKYKVSYLAEECGFSSHSLFTTVFKNKVGVSPIEYIKNIEKS